ncbi:hypothetical protein BC937DRAFT_95388 [Endogone sp. FLAS-F59071]|nr:hypothetical protein BC937DRAFT_95388 [Endogone sp. FLAS-F59071]|eukprot:RUS20355.1 hypothetical protein BC937DRAFT_95388 [Endogone sp. FLAS-F59071]
MSVLLDWLSQGYKVYTELNPATLSGAIDIIVVEQSTGELACSPFHVRFGKLQTLLPQEKKVEIQVNEEHVDFPMKLGEAGEAFFVFETEQEVPEEFQTSPLVGPMVDGDVEVGVGRNSGGFYCGKFRAGVLHSAFCVLHSAFCILRSTFDPWNPSFLDLGPPDSPDGLNKEDGHRVPDSSSRMLVFLSFYVLFGFPAAGYVSAHSAHSDFESESDDEPSNGGAKRTRRTVSEDVPPTIGSPKIIVEEQVEETVTRLEGPASAVLVVEEKRHVEGYFSAVSEMEEAVVAMGEGGGAVESESVEPLSTETTHTSTEQRARVLEDGSTEVERVVTIETSSNIVHSTTTITSETFMIRPFGGVTTSGLLEVTHVKRKVPGEEGEQEVHGLPEVTDVTGKDHIVLDMAGYKTEEAADGEQLNPLRRAETMIDDTRVDLSPATSRLLIARDGLLDDDDDDALSVKSAPLPDHDPTLPPTPTTLPILVPKGAPGAGHHGERSKSMSDDAFDWDDGGAQGPFSDTEVDRGTPERKFTRTSPLSDTEMEYEPQSGAGKKANKVEWSWGWGALPVKKDKETRGEAGKKDKEREREEKRKDEEEEKKKIEGMTTYLIEMSLCGAAEFGADEKKNEDQFKAHQITYEIFMENPNVLNDQNLIFKYQDRYYNWASAGPLFTSLLLHPKPDDAAALISLSATNSSSNLAQANAAVAAAAAKVEADRQASYSLSRSLGRLFTWSSTTSSTSQQVQKEVQKGEPGKEKETENDVMAQQTELTTTTTTTTTTALGVGQLKTAPDMYPEIPEIPNESTPPKNYAKTLRLTSDQLKKLNLKKGVNTVSFSVSSSFSRQNAICVSKIFFWEHTTQIVISDIDGTITKSDALGHLLTIVGRDWTHSGVAKLYTDIHNNGYQILYLTSRAIGQADYTRNYMKNVNQNHYQLPDGPVIMSPDRLLTAFHREVIARKPEIFKMACLRDVQRLFDDRNPFYAGFGNRITDALSYRSVNVPISRIFTIDPNGEVKLELLSGYKSSYLHLNDLVDQIFPPINRKLVEEYNDWNFWKPLLPDYDLPELPLPETKVLLPPKTPPLSSSPPGPSMSDLKLAPSKSLPTQSTLPASIGKQSRRLFFASSADLASSPSASTILPKQGKETASPVQSDDESSSNPVQLTTAEDVTRDQAPGVAAQRANAGDIPSKSANPTSLREEVVEAVKGTVGSLVGKVAGKDSAKTSPLSSSSPPPPPGVDEVTEGEDGEERREDGSEYEGEDEGEDEEEDEDEEDEDEVVPEYEDDIDDIPDLDNVPYL